MTKWIVVTDPHTVPPTWADEADCWRFEVPDDWSKAQIDEFVRKHVESEDWSGLDADPR